MGKKFHGDPKDMMQESEPYWRNQVPSRLQSNSTSYFPLQFESIENLYEGTCQTNKREHTTPQVLDSVMSKIIKQQAKNRLAAPVRKKLSQMSKLYNQASFSMLMLIADKLGVAPAVRSKFLEKAQLRIQKKAWRPTRIEEAQKWLDKYLRAFKAKSIKGQLEIIWQGHNNKNKFKRCKARVYNFRCEINKLAKCNWKK